MVQEGPFTPEKQLLKLIEDAKDDGQDTPVVQKQAARHRRLSLLSGSAWQARFSVFKEKISVWFGGGGAHQINIKLLNGVLGVVLVVLGIFFLREIILSQDRLNKMPAAHNPAPQGVASLPQAVFREPLEYYLEKVRSRDIFNLGIIKVPQDFVFKEAESAPTSRILTATQHLRLVGISWSESPDAMIEDTKAMRTFFVKRGDMVGDIKIEAIFRDKVVLSYFGETIELK